MHDMEKVFKGFEHCKEDNTCYGCPYDIGSSKCIFLFHDDILEVLKEQEPVEPRIQTGSGVSWWYICGKCNAALNPKDAYCSRCGRKVKWDG